MMRNSQRLDAGETRSDRPPSVCTFSCGLPAPPRPPVRKGKATRGAPRLRGPASPWCPPPGQDAFPARRLLPPLGSWALPSTSSLACRTLRLPCPPSGPYEGGASTGCRLPAPWAGGDLPHPHVQRGPVHIHIGGQHTCFQVGPAPAPRRPCAARAPSTLLQRGLPRTGRSDVSRGVITTHIANTSFHFSALSLGRGPWPLCTSSPPPLWGPPLGFVGGGHRSPPCFPLPCTAARSPLLAASPLPTPRPPVYRPHLSTLLHTFNARLG